MGRKCGILHGSTIFGRFSKPERLRIPCRGAFTQGPSVDICTGGVGINHHHHHHKVPWYLNVSDTLKDSTGSEMSEVLGKSMNNSLS